MFLDIVSITIHRSGDLDIVQEQAVAGQAVAPVPNKLDTSHRVIAINPCEDLVMRQRLLLGLVKSFRRPCSNGRVIVLVHADRHRLVDIVANGSNLDIELLVFLSSNGLLCGPLRLQIALPLQEIVRILLCLLPLANFLLYVVDLGSNLDKFILRWNLSIIRRRM